LDSIANVSSVRALNGTPDMGKKGQDLNNFFQTFDIALERTNIAFLFTNKLYASMDMYNPYTESGGNSVVYNTSLSVRLSTVSDSDDVSDAELKEEKERRKSALGSSLKIAKAKITKSRFGTEGRNSSFIIDLNYGITKLSGLFNLLFDFGVITSPSSGWYECPCITKDKFRKKDFIDMVSKNEDKYIDIFQKELEKAEEKIKQNKIEKLESGKIDVSDDEKIEVSGEEIDDFSAIAMEREMMREADK
jgi:RecA/RadA recombinase